MQEAVRASHTIVEGRSFALDSSVAHGICESIPTPAKSMADLIDSLLFEDLEFLKPALRTTTRDISIHDPIRRLRDPSRALPPKAFIRKQARSIA